MEQRKKFHDFGGTTDWRIYYNFSSDDNYTYHGSAYYDYKNLPNYVLNGEVYFSVDIGIRNIPNMFFIK